jgi:hypothetical protein
VEQENEKMLKKIRKDKKGKRRQSKGGNKFKVRNSTETVDIDGEKRKR